MEARGKRSLVLAWLSKILMSRGKRVRRRGMKLRNVT
jgi:hypothetical protein